MITACPSCHAKYAIRESQIGKSATCPKCAHRFQVAPSSQTFAPAPGPARRPTPSREQLKHENGATSAKNPKLRKSLELIERYITMEHPRDPGLALLSPATTKPEYHPGPGGGIVRANYIHIDMKIVSVAGCLKGGAVKASDVDDHNRKAMEAIKHYASLEKVQAFFLLPYYARRGVIIQGRQIEPGELCRVYAGVENLLLEIYAELPDGGIITDEVVERKIDSLVKSLGNA